MEKACEQIMAVTIDCHLNDGIVGFRAGFSEGALFAKSVNNDFAKIPNRDILVAMADKKLYDETRYLPFRAFFARGFYAGFTWAATKTTITRGFKK